MGRSSCATLDALIAEATVDCYNDSECVTGFYTMLDDNLAVPFHTLVLGVDVTVAGIDLTDDEQIMAVCTRGRSTQRIPILDLPLPTPQRRRGVDRGVPPLGEKVLNTVGPCTMSASTGCG